MLFAFYNFILFQLSLIVFYNFINFIFVYFISFIFATHALSIYHIVYRKHVCTLWCHTYIYLAINMFSVFQSLFHSLSEDIQNLYLGKTQPISACIASIGAFLWTPRKYFNAQISMWPYTWWWWSQKYWRAWVIICRLGEHHYDFKPFFKQMINFDTICCVGIYFLYCKV